MNKYFLSLATLLFFSSCSKKLSFFNSNSSKFNLSNVEYKYVSIKSKIKYDDGGKKQKATANIRLQKDSILWFSVTPGMGIEAVRGIITPKEFTIIDRIHKTYIKKPIKEFSDKVHFDLDLALLESILIGNLIWPVERRDDIIQDDKFYIITKEKGDLTIDNYIGANSMKLEKILGHSSSHSNTLDIHYKEFQKISEHVVPKNIEAKIRYTNKRNTQKLSNITIEHLKVDIDNGKLSFPFSIPKKYKAL